VIAVLEQDETAGYRFVAGWATGSLQVRNGLKPDPFED